MRLNQTLPCTIALHNAFQQPAPNSQSDSGGGDRGAENTISGGAETPVEPYTLHCGAPWNLVEPYTVNCGVLHCALDCGDPFELLPSYNHSNLPPYTYLHFDEPQLLGTKQYNVRDGKTDKINTGLVGKMGLALKGERCERC